MDSKIIALIATLVMTIVMSLQNSESHNWEQFKVTYGKVYTSPEEEVYRHAIYIKEEIEVAMHNANQTKNYTKGINQFSDLANEEFRSIYLGYKAKKINNIEKKKVQTKSVLDYFEDGIELTDGEDGESSINWVTKGAVQAVKNQGSCGDCWAFSAAASAESAKFLSVGVLGDFSEQQLCDCSSSYGNTGCSGGVMDYAFQYYEANSICTESSYPYTGVQGTCKASSCTDDSFKVTGYTNCNGVSALQSAILQRPISVAVDASNWADYASGTFSNCGTTLDHGVLLAGYSPTSWLIKNSWGTTWGESGYITLAPGNTCGLANEASYPTGN